MGIYINPGNDILKKDISSDIYIDKTELIDAVNKHIDKSNRFLCVSRPRRFGKTMAANMLSAYYDKSCDSSPLFDNLKISGRMSYRKHLNKYDVLFFNIQKFISLCDSIDMITECIRDRVLKEIKKLYPGADIEPKSLPETLEQLYADKSNNNDGFVIIIDEWDCIFRIAKDNDKAQRKYLDFLRDLFKDRAYVRLAYMTGILPIKKYGTHSALNVFEEYSMVSPGELARYIGFTETEVKRVCKAHNLSYASTKRWYNGYSFSSIKYIYNPKSIVDLASRKKYKSYWTSTETYEALQEYIDLDFEGLKTAIAYMLGGNKINIDVETFTNDMCNFASFQDIFTLLIHLGYLAYDEGSCSVYIPNQEVREEFIRAIGKSKNSKIAEEIRLSKQLLSATLDGDENVVSEIFEHIHNEYSSQRYYNDEQALRSVILLAYYANMEDYVLVQELPTGKGIADVVYIPRKGIDKPALVIELKYDKSAAGAIKQIKDKNYPDLLKKLGHKYVLVEINYDREMKRHEAGIEIVRET